MNLDKHQQSTVTDISLAGPREEWPLTFAERQMATEQFLKPDSVEYNLNLANALSGPLDVPRLERALRALVSKHRVLRSRYLVRPEGFVRILADTEVKLTRVTASSDEVEAKIMAADRPYRLSEEPLYRFTLYTVPHADAPNEAVLHLGFHHAVIDGIGYHYILNDLWSLYTEAADSTPTRPDYLDYAVWASTNKEDDGEEFFADMFQAGLPENEMPTKPQRPDILPLPESEIIQRIPIQPIKNFADSLEVTVYTALMAAWGLTLAKFCGSEDVVLGTAMSARKHPQTEAMPGMFANILPVRIRFQGEDSLHDYVRQCGKTLKSLRERRTYPFGNLVQTLAPERNDSRYPLFDMLVNYLHEPPAPTVPGLTIRPVTIKLQAVAVDLRVEMRRDRGDLSICLLYSNRLYEDVVAEKIVEHFCAVLERMTTGHEMTLEDAAELPETQRRQLLVDFLPPKSEENLGHTLVDLFRERARQFASRPAVVAVKAAATGRETRETIDYATLDRLTDALAVHLTAKGIGRGKTVGVLVRRHAMMVIGALGILKTGAAYVPLDPTYPSERLEFMLEDAAASLVILDTELGELLPGFLGERLSSDAVRKLNEVAVTSVLPEGPEPNDTVVLLYTSGTTGKPKGVMLSHANLLSFSTWFCRHFTMTELDNAAAYASYGFDACLMDLYPTLLAGASTLSRRKCGLTCRN